jgi:hypothetical protein
MFGAPVAYFFEYLLGIRQKEGTVGYTHPELRPLNLAALRHLRGSIETPLGTLGVAYQRTEGEIRFTLTVPEGATASFFWEGKEYPLSAGENRITLPLS